MIPEALHPIANHLWQSTIFAAAAALLSLALRRNRAQLRYRLWLAASLKFLVPFAPLLAIGSRLEWPHATPAAVPLASAIGQIGEPFAAAIAAPAPLPSATAWLWLYALIALWLTGAAVIGTWWWWRWRPVRRSMAQAVRLPVSGPVPVFSSPTRLEPGVFGVFRPVVLLPEGLAGSLSPAQFHAVLAHEFCHVRRRDNLAAALHMMVEAIFWFHPLVWWLGARLIDERERACDEEVLRLGSDPEAYAAGILNVCRFYLESPLACASGVTGADLRRRVEAIMTRDVLPNLTPARKLLLAAAGVLAIIMPIAIGSGRAQPAAPALRFEVATIKPIRVVGKGSLMISPGGTLTMGGTTLKSLIAMAYGVNESQIKGGPPWIDSVSYEVVAKPGHPDPGSAQAAPGNAAWKRMQERLQALLAERFQLAVHKDAKPGSVLALVVGKGGAKLEPTKLEGVPPGTLRSATGIVGRAATMQMLATVLTNWLHRPVEDRTGLTGSYDYVLSYARDPDPLGENPVADAPGAPSFFTALQEQLGLKLEAARGSIETLVVDRAQKPSAN